MREDLNKRALRVMAVLRPLSVVIDNYPEGQTEEMEAVNNPEDASAGHAQSSVLEGALHRAGRLPRGPAEAVFPPLAGPRGAAALRLLHHLHERGEERRRRNVVEVHCTYDPATRGGNAPDGRKVKSTIHWVSAEHAVDGEVRLYDNLFTQRESERSARKGQDFTANLNPNSLEVVTGRKLEPSLADAAAGEPLSVRAARLLLRGPDSAPGKPVFNRTVALARHVGQNRKAGKGISD